MKRWLWRAIAWMIERGWIEILPADQPDPQAEEWALFRNLLEMETFVRAMNRLTAQQRRDTLERLRVAVQKQDWQQASRAEGYIEAWEDVLPQFQFQASKHKVSTKKG